MTRRTKRGWTKRTPEQQAEWDQKCIDTFNGYYPVGSRVWYWSSLPFGPVKETVIKRGAFFADSGEMVCFLEGVSGLLPPHQWDRRIST